MIVSRSAGQGRLVMHISCIGVAVCFHEVLDESDNLTVPSMHSCPKAFRARSAAGSPLVNQGCSGPHRASEAREEIGLETSS